MNIRKANSNDIKLLQNLNDELFQDNSKYDPDLKLDWAQSEAGKNYFTELLDNRDAICLIAEENGKPIGYLAAAQKEFSYRQSKYIEIENMGVNPDFRSKGIGTKLIEECMRIAKERGFNRAFVNAYWDNTRATDFYTRNGFKKIDISLEKDL